MRYSNYEIKRFSAERLDIDFDILNDRFLQHIQEVGLGPGRAWINCSRQPLRIDKDLFFGPDHMYTYTIPGSTAMIMFSMTCLGNKTYIQIVERSFEPDDARKYEDLRFCFLFQKINAIHDEISEAMKKTLLEFGIIKNEEEYYIGINGVGGSKMNALEAIGSHVMLSV